MSRENVELVTGLFEAVNARDFAAALDGDCDGTALEAAGLSE